MRTVDAPTRNWAGNVTYSAARILRPRTTDEAHELIARTERIRPLGTRHSFSVVADTGDALLSTEHLDRIVEITNATVTIESGIRYGELGRALHEHGLALPNFASLPHISVGGAIATSTHGSGARNQSLAAAVRELELIRADGSKICLRRGDAEFDGAVVSLGALGLATRVTLDVVPAFELRQYVFEQLPWPDGQEHLEAMLAGGYSVSLFTTWDEPAIAQAWVKTTDELTGPLYFGGTPARGPRHPVANAQWQNATEQLGVPGPSDERLPHFRLGFTPSSGAELQTEYLIPRAHGAAAIAELRRLATLIEPLLLVSEIRSIASDQLWLSPFWDQDSVALHFTWKPLPREVLEALPRIEAALTAFGARPHWGKLFVGSRESIEASYPRLTDFRALARAFDPGGKFRNAFLERYVLDVSPATSAS